MLSSFIKIALRSLFKKNIYGIINILGLATGMAGCVLIGLFVEDEYSYDTFHEKSDQIYRLALERIYPTHSTYYSITPHSFGTILPEDFPQVQEVVRLFNFNNPVVFRHEKSNGEMLVLEEKSVVLADSNFFRVFSFPLIKGNADQVLKGGNSMVMTESAAIRFFGNNDPINQIVETAFGEFKITGICRDLPANSHIKFDLLGSFYSLPFFNNLNFTGFSAHQYLVLSEGTDPEELVTKFPEMVRKYAGPQIQQNLNVNYDEYVNAGNGYRYFLQPLTRIHLHSHYENEIQPNGNIAIVNIFISISLFILIIACINFINLATARSAERAKEVGIRKAMGSSRSKIIWQFTIEFIVISLVSVMLSVILVNLFLPVFNQLSGKSLGLDLNGLMFPLLIIFGCFVGLLAGIYPAFYLSSYQPSEVVKGRFSSGREGKWLRNGLVIFQFIISIILIAGTLTVYKQLRYIQNKPLGFDKDGVLVIERANVLDDQYRSFISELKKFSFVNRVGASSSLPGRDQFFGQFFQLTPGSEVFTTKNMFIDHDYVETMKLNIILGRDFDISFDDSLSLILNEAAIKAFGLTDPIGETLTVPANGDIPPITYTIVGILEDFNFQSLHNEVTPLTIFYAESPPYISIRIQTGNLSDAVSQIENLWKDLLPDEPFKFTFLDEEMNQLYFAEINSGKILFVFSILAILIASIGLFGLATYTTIRRKKEIGIRKVLGSTESGIIRLLSGSFMKLIGIAFLIAVPVTYAGMDMWLKGFAYRVNLEATFPVVITLAGSLAFFIAILTISYHSVKAALTNPVDSLHYE
jgi:putative ABC transport system permease protein